MTPFGANDSAISQTKCFSTLMSLNVFHRNKKKKIKGSPCISTLSQSLAIPFLGWICWEREYFPFMFPSKSYHFLLFSHLSCPLSK